MKKSLKRFLKNNFPIGLALARAVLAPLNSIKNHFNRIKRKRWVAKVISKEGEKLSRAKHKSRLNIAFIVIHYPTWKTSSLYQLLANDPQFSPYIIIAPDTANDAEWSKEEAIRAYDHFKSQNYEVHLGSRNHDENKALIERLAPDIVFFNNPHGLTNSALHSELIERCLTCYVPYHVEVGKYNNDQDQYNRPFHNAVWKIFSPHRFSLETFKRKQERQGRNVVVTGYPGLEPLAKSLPHERSSNKKKIIWAPHHTIASPSLPYSNFFRYSDFFLSLAKNYEDEIEWIFKPHPLLKSRLIGHELWGRDRTEEYYSFWRDGSNTRLELDGYADLFVESDAMIHDSGSFLAEYLYVNKPVMYLWSSPNLPNFFNDFGLSALSACQRGDDESDIRRFIEDVLADRDTTKRERRKFLDDNPVVIDGTTPSERIVHELKRALKTQPL